MTATATLADTSTAAALVKSMYAAFNRGDIEFILSRISPDCRWVAPGEGIPSAGVYTGPAGVAEFFRKLSESEQILRLEPREYLTGGDAVVVLGLEECRVISTGKKVSTNWSMLFRVRDGFVTQFESFYDTEAYLRAHQP